MLKFIYQSTFVLLLSSSAWIQGASAQSEKTFIRNGNKEYQDKKYSESEINYRKGIEANSSSFEGAFNLGDALYKQGKYEEATDYFCSAISREKDKNKLSKAYHNLGNSLLQQKKYPESIEAYKNSLKQNPNDKETKYNLAYAKSMLQNQEQQQQKDGDKKDDKQNDKKDQQQGDKKEEKKGDQKEEQQKQGEQKDSKENKDQQASKPKEQKISREDAERILQALKNEEKETQKKLSKKESVRMNIEKDW